MSRLIIIILSAVLPLTLLAQPSPVWKIYYDSAQLYWGKDWQKTIPLLLRAEPSALNDLGIYDENYLTIVNDLGLAYAQIKDYKKAETLLNKVLTIKTELTEVPDAELYQTMNNLAGVHSDQRHYQQAALLYKRILSGYAAQTNLDPAIYWSAVKSLGRLYETQDQLDSALMLLDKLKSKELGSSNENVVGLYDVRLTRGRINRKLKKYEEATAVLETLRIELQHQTDQKLFQIYIESLQEAGLLYAETGLYDKAEKNLLLAFRLLKSEQPVNHALLIGVLNNLGSVYEKLGIYDKATVYYQDALELSIREYGASALSSATLQSNIAGIYLKEGNLNEAIRRYKEIVRVLETSIPTSALFYPTVLNNLATAYRKNGDYKQASELLEVAYRDIQKNKLENNDLAATVLNNQAVLQTTLGQLDKAITSYEKAYALRKSIYGDNSVLLMDLASNMAVVYWAQNKTELSIPLFQKSISLALRQIKYIFPNLSEKEQVQFYERLKEDFERFSAIAFQSGKGELLIQAFNNQATIKSLLFFTQQHRSAQIAEKNDTTLLHQYEMLKAKREQLGYFYQLSLRELASAETTAAALEQEIDKLEKAISLKTSETVAEKMMEQGIQWSDLQPRVLPEEAVVDMIRLRKYDLKTYVEQNADRVQFGFTDSIYYAALITTAETKQKPHLILLKDGTNMETRYLNYYRNALTYLVPDENSYPSYWKPFEHVIANKSKIYFSGDGVYHRLNLNTLREPKKNEFLIQRYDIHYLLNPAQFFEKDKKTFVSKSAVLVGDPVFDGDDISQTKKTNTENLTFSSLPGTNKEVAEINTILKANTWTTNVYLKKLASEKNVKSVRSPDILHVATHGFFSAGKIKLSAEVKKDFLFYSGLVFAGANRNLDKETLEIHDDGILTAFEVMNLNLSNTHLVVLSACETGLGKIENGEGVYGLQRSFLQAGARNILISLWKVDDRMTQELMVKFYTYLFQGKSVRDALRNAQVEQLKKNNNPAGWGGFIVVGFD